MKLEVFDINIDLERVITMAKEMHCSSLFNRLELNMNKIVQLFITADDNDGGGYYFRVVRDGQIAIGFMLAVAGPHFCSDDLYAVDLLIWVDPGYRGTLAGKLLVEGYLDWCEDVGVVLPMIGSTTGIDIERTKSFFKGFGLECVGHNFVRV